MRKIKNYLVIVLLALISFSCSKENEELDVEKQGLDKNLSSVALVATCPDETVVTTNYDFFVTAGNNKNLTKYRRPYLFSLPTNPDTGSRYMKRDVVGMGVDGDANLCFAWYKNHKYSAGASDDLSSVRLPSEHTYVLPKNPQTDAPYLPSDIVGMAIDGENNTVYTWYKNNYYSAGSPANLGSKRSPRHYDLAVNPRTGEEFRPNQIRAIVIDGGANRTIVFYQNRYVSEGRTYDLDYFTAQSGGEPYCLTNLPATNIKTRDFLGAGLDYTNGHFFVWSKGRPN